MCGHICAGKVDGSGKTCEALELRNLACCRWIPLHFAGLGGSATHKLENLGTTILERLAQTGSYHPGCAGQEEFG